MNSSDGRMIQKCTATTIMLPVQANRIQMNSVERKLASVKLLNYLDATKVIFKIVTTIYQDTIKQMKKMNRKLESATRHKSQKSHRRKTIEDQAVSIQDAPIGSPALQRLVRAST